MHTFLETQLKGFILSRIIVTSTILPIILLLHIISISSILHHLTIQIWLWPEILRVKCLPDVTHLNSSSPLITIHGLAVSFTLPCCGLILTTSWSLCCIRSLLLRRRELRRRLAHCLHVSSLVILYIALLLKLRTESWQISWLIRVRASILEVIEHFFSVAAGLVLVYSINWVLGIVEALLEPHSFEWIVHFADSCIPYYGVSLRNY